MASPETMEREELRLYAARIEHAARHRWLKTEEILCVLLNYEAMGLGLSSAAMRHPQDGQLALFDRRLTRNFKDDHVAWVKKNKKNRVREDHVKLQLLKANVVYGTYAHGELDPCFHRRCYRRAGTSNSFPVHLVHYRRDLKQRGDSNERRPSIPCVKTPECLTRSLVAITEQLLLNGSGPSSPEEMLPANLDEVAGTAAMGLRPPAPGGLPGGVKEGAQGVPPGMPRGMSRGGAAGPPQIPPQGPMAEMLGSGRDGPPMPPAEHLPLCARVGSMRGPFQVLGSLAVAQPPCGYRLGGAPPAGVHPRASRDSGHSRKPARRAGPAAAHPVKREMPPPRAASPPPGPGPSFFNDGLMNSLNAMGHPTLQSTPPLQVHNAGEGPCRGLTPMDASLSAMFDGIADDLSGDDQLLASTPNRSLAQCLLWEHRQAANVASLPSVVDFGPCFDDSRGGAKMLLCLDRILPEHLLRRKQDICVRIGPTIIRAEVLEPGCTLRCYVPPLSQNVAPEAPLLFPVQVVGPSGEPLSRPAATKFQYARQSLDQRKRHMSATKLPRTKAPALRDLGLSSPVEPREAKIRIVERLGTLTSALPCGSAPPTQERPPRPEGGAMAEECIFTPLNLAEVSNWGPDIDDVHGAEKGEDLQPMDEDVLAYFDLESASPRRASGAAHPRCDGIAAMDTASAMSSPRSDMWSLLRRSSGGASDLHEEDSIDFDGLSEGDLQNLLDDMLIRVVDQLVDLGAAKTADVDTADVDLTWLANELNAADESGNSLLHYCCAFGIAELLVPLLRYGAAINLRNNDGDTPLHIACRTGSVEIVAALLRRGATTQCANFAGNGPFEATLEARCDEDHRAEILALLSQHSANHPQGSEQSMRGSLGDNVSHASEPVMQEAFQALSLHDKCALQLSLHINDSQARATPSFSYFGRPETTTSADSELESVLSNCPTEGLDRAMSKMTTEERHLLEDEARRIAKNVRAWFTQKQYANLRSAARTLQLAWRDRQQSRLSDARPKPGEGGTGGPAFDERAAVRLQAMTRGALTRMENEQVKKKTVASLKIQRALLRWRMLKHQQ